jgi:hypothetical protein
VIFLFGLERVRMAVQGMFKLESIQNRLRVIYVLSILLDPSLTLTRTQLAAIPGKRGKEESLIYAGFASVCNAQQPLTAHS